MSYQNYPDPNVVNETQNGEPEEEEDSTNRQYNFPPPAVPVPVPVQVSRMATENTKLLEHPLDNVSTKSDDVKKLSPAVNPRTSLQLSHLATVEQIFIREHIEVTEGTLGLGRNGQTRSFKIIDSHGHRLLLAQFEKGTGCQWVHLTVKDRHDKQIIRLSIPCLSSCCFPACQCITSTSMKISWEDASPIGRIEQSFSIGSFLTCSKNFNVLNSANERLFTIVGPKFGNSICFNFCNKGEFKIQTESENGVEEIGKISNRWPNQVELGKSKDMLGINFPKDLKPVDKTLLISVCILLQLTHF